MQPVNQQTTKQGKMHIDSCTQYLCFIKVKLSRQKWTNPIYILAVCTILKNQIVKTSGSDFC